MIYENILRLQIPMKYSLSVDICYSIQYLLHNNLNFFLIRFIIFASDELLEVIVIVVKNDFKQLFFRLVFDIY